MVFLHTSLCSSRRQQLLIMWCCCYRISISCCATVFWALHLTNVRDNDVLQMTYVFFNHHAALCTGVMHYIHVESCKNNICNIKSPYNNHFILILKWLKHGKAQTTIIDFKVENLLCWWRADNNELTFVTLLQTGRVGSHPPCCKYCSKWE